MNQKEIQIIKANVRHTKKRLKMLEKTKRKNSTEIWYLRGRCNALDDILKKRLPLLKKVK